PPSIPALFPYTTLFRSRVWQQRSFSRKIPDHSVGPRSLQSEHRMIHVSVDRRAGFPLHRQGTQLSAVQGHPLHRTVGHAPGLSRSEEHTSELQSRENLV